MTFACRLAKSTLNFRQNTSCSSHNKSRSSGASAPVLGSWFALSKGGGDCMFAHPFLCITRLGHSWLSCGQCAAFLGLVCIRCLVPACKEQLSVFCFLLFDLKRFMPKTVDDSEVADSTYKINAKLYASISFAVIWRELISIHVIAVAITPLLWVGHDICNSQERFWDTTQCSLFFKSWTDGYNNFMPEALHKNQLQTCQAALRHQRLHCAVVFTE